MVAAHLENFCSAVYEALENIACVLEIQKNTLIKSESLALCTFAGSCSDDKFTDNFSQEHLDAWYSLFGNDLNIDVFIEELDTHEQITCNDQSGLNNIKAVLDRYEIDVVDIRVTIKKEVLKSKVRDIVHVPSISALFFYESTLIESLTLKQIQALQNEGAFSPDQHTVIAILTGVGMLQGPLLTVFGQTGGTIEEISHLPKIEPTMRAWHKARSLRDTTTTWTAPLADIAPSTFQVEQIHAGLEATHNTMEGICNILSLLQFCVSVLEGESEIWHVAVAYPGGPIIDIASNLIYQADSTPDISPSLYRLYRWAFLAESYDKIDIVRELLRHMIRRGETNLLSKLIASGSELLEEARANYKILRRQAFDAYLRSRQETIEAIHSFMTSTRKDLDTLRKDVLDTTLRFSAGIIAFLAANVLQLNLSIFVISVGFGLGIFYIILAIIFQLTPLWQQYIAQYSEAVQAVDAHSELTSTERSRFIGQLPNKRWNSFKKWFLVCFISYLVWALVLIILLISLLNLNINSNTHQLHPIPTPHATHASNFNPTILGYVLQQVIIADSSAVGNRINKLSL